MEIRTRRIYDEDEGPQGYRVLVDRLWPRGLSRERAALDAWWKELAPSDELRRWFGHEEARWAEFRKRYLHELTAQREQARAQLAAVEHGPLILLYAAADHEHNNAKVLKEYLGRLKTVTRARKSPPGAWISRPF